MSPFKNSSCSFPLKLSQPRKLDQLRDSAVLIGVVSGRRTDGPAAAHRDSRVLLRGNAVHALSHQPNRVVASLRVSVVHLPALFAGAVAKVPAIAQSGHPIP